MNRIPAPCHPPKIFHDRIIGYKYSYKSCSVDGNLQMLIPDIMSIWICFLTNRKGFDRLCQGHIMEGSDLLFLGTGMGSEGLTAKCT